jgi:hypothetical protein
MDNDDHTFRLRLALHLLPLSICLRGVYLLSLIQMFYMMMYPSEFRWFPFIAMLTGALLEWQAINLLRQYKVVPVQGDDEDE